MLALVLTGSAAGAFELGQAPTTRDAQAVADELYSNFVSEEVDKVELVYTKFVSLISSNQTIQTLLPLTPQVCCNLHLACPGFSQVSKLIKLQKSFPESPLIACRF